MIIVFRRERVLQKKQAIRFERLAEIDRLIQGHALVHIVEQLHIIPELSAQVLKQLWHDSYVWRRFPDVPRAGGTHDFVLRATPRRTAACRPIAGVTRRRDLYAHVTESLLHGPPGVVFPLRKTATARAKVAVCAVPHLAAKQLIEWHPCAFGFDVPKSDVNATHSVE